MIIILTKTYFSVLFRENSKDWCSTKDQRGFSYITYQSNRAVKPHTSTQCDPFSGHPHTVTHLTVTGLPLTLCLLSTRQEELEGSGHYPGDWGETCCADNVDSLDIIPVCVCVCVCVCVHLRQHWIGNFRIRGGLTRSKGHSRSCLWLAFFTFFT